MAKVEYGLQMYSLRDITGTDLKGALKLVAEMGYKYIEFAGFFGHPAEDVRQWLEEYGLVCSGTHTGGDALAEDKLMDTIAYHKAIGCGDLIIPGMDYVLVEKTLGKFGNRVEVLNDLPINVQHLVGRNF